MARIIIGVELILLVLIVGGIIFLIVKSWPFRARFYIKEAFDFSKKLVDEKEEFKQEVQEKFDSIVAKMASEHPEDWKIAILEADHLIDEVLIWHGHRGKDMGERLKSITEREVESINELWQAHKLRNQIAHNINIEISKKEAEKAIEIYRKVLKEFNLF